MRANTIGERIAECRRNKGLTQFDLAELLCTKKSTISSYENDKIDIKISILMDIAKYLGTTVGYLAEGESEDVLADEAESLIQSMSDERIKRVAIEQLRALSNL